MCRRLPAWPLNRTRLRSRSHPTVATSCATYTKPLCALEMICRMADPQTTNMKSASTAGPTVNWLFFFREPLFDTLPMFLSYCADLSPVRRDCGILDFGGGRQAYANGVCGEFSS